MKTAFAVQGVLFFVILVGMYLAFSTYQPNEKIPMTLSLTSSVFEHDGLLPQKYTCDGEKISPPLTISGVPKEAQSLVLIMDDPDIPQEAKDRLGVEIIDHWVVYNIPTDTVEIEEASHSFGSLGLNRLKEPEYLLPCPPDKEHRYFFKLYALSGSLNFIKAPTKAEVESAIEGMIIEQAELVGRYNRPQNK